MELVRKILLIIEASPIKRGSITIEIDGYSDEEISYHIQILKEHGIIEAADYNATTRYCWRAKKLTWDGHDYLDAIRDDTRWEKIKAWISSAGKILTIETIKQAVDALFM